MIDNGMEHHMAISETPDFIEAGQGPKVILFHSSVSGARQWRSLMDMLSDRYHLVAINLFGYGKTPAWSDSRTQSLADQASLAEPFLTQDGDAVSIIGHSFGGSVAMKAAALYKDQVDRLVLIEPNPFYLLEQHGKLEGYKEATKLRDAIKASGQSGSWETAAKVFANYWTGKGSWDAMPNERRSKFAEALKPNFHEWDAVMNETTTMAEWEAGLPDRTTVISANDTVRSIREICGVMEASVPRWNHKQIDQGGHMAALTKPDLINPIVADALA
ncbi:alpha/beta fold hydrolase [Tateyamaria pelophila]|uniref:alpha/beta fold hydrolase n=1 Tax=Tateyamaria pelophila TaxID=328415 RepID=UPI001CBCDDE3|nr:alpha/beta hydrolase [Tateyamaria pelophila]